jgi:hypothetical protein
VLVADARSKAADKSSYKTISKQEVDEMSTYSKHSKT